MPGTTTAQTTQDDLQLVPEYVNALNKKQQVKLKGIQEERASVHSSLHDAKKSEEYLQKNLVASAKVELVPDVNNLKKLAPLEEGESLKKQYLDDAAYQEKRSTTYSDNLDAFTTQINAAVNNTSITAAELDRNISIAGSAFGQQKGLLADNKKELAQVRGNRPHIQNRRENLLANEAVFRKAMEYSWVAGKLLTIQKDLLQDPGNTTKQQQVIDGKAKLQQVEQELKQACQDQKAVHQKNHQAAEVAHTAAKKQVVDIYSAEPTLRELGVAHAKVDVIREDAKVLLTEVDIRTLELKGAFTTWNNARKQDSYQNPTIAKAVDTPLLEAARRCEQGLDETEKKINQLEKDLITQKMSLEGMQKKFGEELITGWQYMPLTEERGIKNQTNERIKKQTKECEQTLKQLHAHRNQLRHTLAGIFADINKRPKKYLGIGSREKDILHAEVKNAKAGDYKISARGENEITLTKYEGGKSQIAMDYPTDGSDEKKWEAIVQFLGKAQIYEYQTVNIKAVPNDEARALIEVVAGQMGIKVDFGKLQPKKLDEYPNHQLKAEEIAKKDKANVMKSKEFQNIPDHEKEARYVHNLQERGKGWYEANKPASVSSLSQANNPNAVNFTIQANAGQSAANTPQQPGATNVQIVSSAATPANNAANAVVPPSSSSSSSSSSLIISSSSNSSGFTPPSGTGAHSAAAAAATATATASTETNLTITSPNP